MANRSACDGSGVILVLMWHLRASAVFFLRATNRYRIPKTPKTLSPLPSVHHSASRGIPTTSKNRIAIRIRCRTGVFGVHPPCFHVFVANHFRRPLRPYTRPHRPPHLLHCSPDLLLYCSPAQSHPPSASPRLCGSSPLPPRPHAAKRSRRQRQRPQVAVRGAFFYSPPPSLVPLPPLVCAKNRLAVPPSIKYCTSVPVARFVNGVCQRREQPAATSLVIDPRSKSIEQNPLCSIARKGIASPILVAPGVPRRVPPSRRRRRATRPPNSRAAAARRTLP